MRMSAHQIRSRLLALQEGVTKVFAGTSANIPGGAYVDSDLAVVLDASGVNLAAISVTETGGINGISVEIVSDYGDGVWVSGMTARKIAASGAATAAQAYDILNPTRVGVLVYSTGAGLHGDYSVSMSISDVEGATALAATVTPATATLIELVQPVKYAEVANVIRVTAEMKNDLLDAVLDGTVSAAIAIVENGGALAASGQFSVSSGDGGDTVVNSIGTTGKGLYSITPKAATGVFDIDITDVAGASGKTLNTTWIVMGAGASGLNISDADSVQTLSVTFN